MKLVPKNSNGKYIVSSSDLVFCAYSMSKAGFNAEIDCHLNELKNVVIEGASTCGSEMALILDSLDEIYQVSLQVDPISSSDPNFLMVSVRLPSGQLDYRTAVSGNKKERIRELADLLAPLFSYHQHSVSDRNRSGSISRCKVIGLKDGCNWKVLSSEAGIFLDEVLNILGCDPIECYGEGYALEWFEVLAGKKEGRKLSLDEVLFSPER